MTNPNEAIAAGVALLPELRGDVARMKDHAARTGRSHILEKAITEKETIIAALEAMEGVADGTHYIMKIGDKCGRWPYCGCKGGLMVDNVCHDRAKIAASQQKV
jgi:hypothetical protein